ncbi:DEAD/DEAH box helicase [Fructilactobacillus vespulae]|uniref:DEAD/DEAH box helicase n=1 Tax=Fructilactobacillus vespulae TaxID=1249630 RepID=UPI0039B58DD3
MVKDQKINKIIESMIMEQKIVDGKLEKNDKQVTIHTNFITKKKDVKGTEIYLGIYSAKNLRDLICNNFNTDKVHNEDSSKYFSLAVIFDKDMNFKEIFLPYSALIFKGLKEKGNKYNFRNIKTEHDEIIESLDTDIKEICNHANPNQESWYDLLKELNCFVRQKFYTENSHFYGKINYTKDPVNLNSLYLDDLQIIRDNPNNDLMISKFLHGYDKDQQEIDKNKNLINQILNIKNIPLGRWPSAIEHNQSLMQQVAINIIESDTENLLSVNGPPGTGKTSLLKDVFADMMVKRAKEMVKFSHPQEGFEKIEKKDLSYNQDNSFKPNSYRLKDNLKGFGIIVTSNNNAAVENISKDFPNIDEINTHSNKKYKNEFSEKLQSIDFFKNIEKDILGTEINSWGSFAVHMGRKKNRDKVQEVVLQKDNDLQGKYFNKNEWNNAIGKFNDALHEVEKCRDEIYEQSKQFKDNITEINNFESIMNYYKQFLSRYEADLRHWNLKMFFANLLRFKWTTKNCVRNKIEKIQTDISRTKENKQIFENENEKISKNKFILESYDFSKDNSKIQLKTPWETEKLREKRSNLFIEAINIHKMFALGASREIRNSWYYIKNRNKLSYPKDTEILENAFAITQLNFPVMSTTTASIQSMFKNFGQNSLDNVFMDEAGQASAYSALGAIWRAKKFVAIGDPSQIEPVSTIDPVFLKMLTDLYKINDIFLSETRSVQTFTDSGSHYIHKTKLLNDQVTTIGIPLWVHRRCQSPMFDISNMISYESKMIQGTKKKEHNLESLWIDCKGQTTIRQYVPNQTEILAKFINLRIALGASLNDIYVITPFTAVKDGIKNDIKAKLQGKISKDELKSFIDNSIGTVHTFQGKENKIVYFVVGTDHKSEGSARWSISKPNILNVAVTRAKEEFYLVGDYDLLSKMNYYSNASQKLKRVDENYLKNFPNSNNLNTYS